jgi:CRISPR-associated protein Cmr5
MRTRQQAWASKACELVAAVSGRGRNGITEAEYKRFCKGFPALVHTSGLCQALAFAEARNRSAYVADLATVLQLSHEQLLRLSRDAGVADYQKLSRESLAAATWLKRYAEALLKGDEDDD